MSLEVVDVQGNPEHQRLFDELPRTLYASDPFYITKNEDIPAGSRHRAFLILRNGKAAARASAIVTPGLSYQGLPTGMIGLYECEQERSTSDLLFRAIESELREQGCKYILGPMNGSTWNSYRLVEPGSDRPFFMGIHHAPWYVQQFEEQGFERIAGYHSSRQLCAGNTNERVARFEGLFAKRGIRIRNVDLTGLRDDLCKVHSVSVRGFAPNFLFTPISLDSFLSLYTGVEKILDPRFALLAEEADGSPCAYILGINNLLDRTRRALVIKTVATLPDPRYRGLGTLLVEKIHETARLEGYDEIIHALMHDRNSSTRILGDQAETKWRYSLFGRVVGTF